MDAHAPQPPHSSRSARTRDIQALHTPPRSSQPTSTAAATRAGGRTHPSFAPSRRAKASQRSGCTACVATDALGSDSSMSSPRRAACASASSPARPTTTNELAIERKDGPRNGALWTPPPPRDGRPRRCPAHRKRKPGGARARHLAARGRRPPSAPVARAQRGRARPVRGDRGPLRPPPPRVPAPPGLDRRPRAPIHDGSATRGRVRRVRRSEGRGKATVRQSPRILELASAPLVARAAGSRWPSCSAS